MAEQPDIELVRRYLAGLEPDELVRRLLAAAQRDDALELALTTEARAATGTFDLAGLKKKLTAQLRVPSRFMDWRASRSYARRVDATLDVLQALLDGGRAAAVVLLAEHVMKRLDTALGKIDDSGGFVADPVERLKRIHHEACLLARPEPRKLAGRLLETALKSDWEWFLDAPTRYADVLGDEGLAVYRGRLEREWQKLPPLDPSPSPFSPRHDHSRFTVTYLREQLARAHGSVDELVAVLAHDRSTAYRFVLIADELERAGREREALAWLERGIAAFPPAGDARLRARLTAAYRRDGQLDDASRLAERAFAHDPTAATYRELRDATPAESWEARRPEALARLRSAAPRGLRQGSNEVVLAQLAESDLDGAWRDARDGGCTRQVWLELADASREALPDDAVAVYLNVAGTELEHSHVGNYERGVDLLTRARNTLAAAGRDDELAPVVARIRDENRRRPRLMSMLDEAGLR